ncbi:TauD/TfdA family dioxygenase [Nocardiopsis alkaliphila]|uniref:TauD/TfdA family dioxygenase n=1 Tax=Nocardiopsis alkaliphila TaxID=225762 RepID=UPI0003764CD7|nr:TauD/TfdA family dioxygenase [Nocardiopsis alkaliphila]
MEIQSSCRELHDQGYVIIPNLGSVEEASEIVQSFGDLIPQYSGKVTHEITYRPGNESRSYSQSTNTILAHTEAPGWPSSPEFIALYCHRQARCGGGHTDLLSADELLLHLDPTDTRLMKSVLDFPGPPDLPGLKAPMLEYDDQGRPRLRFSCNLLTHGEFDPDLGAATEERALPLGAEGRRLAQRVSEIFEKHRTSVLIPDNALLIWDNRRLLHARSEYEDKGRHFTRFWFTDGSAE